MVIILIIIPIVMGIWVWANMGFQIPSQDTYNFIGNWRYLRRYIKVIKVYMKPLNYH